MSEADRDAIQTLAVQIFIKNSPTDPAALPEPYIKCLEVGRSYKACVISGRFEDETPKLLTVLSRVLLKAMWFCDFLYLVFASSD